MRNLEPQTTQIDKEFIGGVLPTNTFLKRFKRMSLREWIGKSGIVLRGAQYSTQRHEYLNTIIDDDHPWQIYMKGAQVAMSTTMLIKTLYVAEHLGK